MTESMTPPSAQTRNVNRDGIKTIVRHQVTAIVISGLVFLGAGTSNWAWGWVFAITYIVCWLGLNLVLLRGNPELLNARGRRITQLTGTKSWDWILLILYSLVFFLQPMIAGADYRNGWSAPSAPIVHVFGNLLMSAAYALLTWAMVVNRFFEGTVRIQDQRGHRVISTGPYRYLCHPGYTSVILSFLALPIALGAWIALIPGIVGVVVFCIRTALEDKTLQSELPGYTDYARATPYRLLPGVW